MPSPTTTKPKNPTQQNRTTHLGKNANSSAGVRMKRTICVVVFTPVVVSPATSLPYTGEPHLHEKSSMLLQMLQHIVSHSIATNNTAIPIVTTVSQQEQQGTRTKDNTARLVP